MSSLLVILLSTVLVNIAVLTSAPAWRPFAAITDTYEGARAVAIAALLTIPPLALLTWALGHGLLRPLGLEYLRTPAFVAILLVLVPLAEMALRRHGRWIPQRPGFTLLMTTSSLALGLALRTDARLHNPLDVLAFAIAGAAALGFLLLAFAAIHERLHYADVPAVFRHAPLALITAGIAALAFMGFTGLIQE
jgi:electron transport complex protein RnfA